MVKSYRLFIFLYLFLFSSQYAIAHNLTLKQAQRIAIKRSSELQELAAQTHELYQTAIANSQLMDPKLNVALANLPTDSFNLSQEPMTQIQLGIEQVLPKGASLKYEFLSLQQNSQAKSFDRKTKILQIRQKTRQAWLMLSFGINAKTIIYKQQTVFKDLVNVTQSMLANNKAKQQDVLLAQLELSQIRNKLIDVNQTIKVARSELARWVGEVNLKKINPSHMPYWPLNSKAELFDSLKVHSILESDQKLINAKKSQIQLAKEQFKVGFVLGAGYGFRQGNNVNGTKRTDFLQLKLGMSLPVLPSNRQQRSLRAKQLSLVSQENLGLSHLRTLKEMLKTNLAIFKLKQSSINLYLTSLIPQAQQYAAAARLSYENVQTDLPTVSRAYIKQFNIEMDLLKSKRDITLARINLLFIQGL